MHVNITSGGFEYFITMFDQSLQPQVWIVFLWIKTRVKWWQGPIGFIRWQSMFSARFPLPVGRSQLCNYCGHFLKSIQSESKIGISNMR